MNEDLVDDVLNSEQADENDRSTSTLVLRFIGTMMFSFLAVCAGALVAGMIVTVVTPDMGFRAGYYGGVITSIVTLGLLRRFQPQIRAMLPGSD